MLCDTSLCRLLPIHNFFAHIHTSQGTMQTLSQFTVFTSSLPILFIIGCLCFRFSINDQTNLDDSYFISTMTQ